MQIVRTTSESKDFKDLMKKLDTYLASMNNEDHSFMINLTRSIC